jgi:hypothetical protein
LLDGVTSKGTEKSKKSSNKSKEAEAKAEAPDPEMQANFLLDLKKAMEAAENAKGKMITTANKMFHFYTNLLSVEAKYAWNKIVTEQMASNPYGDLQGVFQKGPRGVSRQSFEDCVLFHLLSLFPINTAEREKYYITNVLMKPQRISVHQFVGPVEQLNTYILQLPCFYNSPSANSTTIPANVLFTKAELGSHILWMCPLQWQDQYNLHKRGMILFNMHSLLTSLEAIEHICTQEKASAPSKKASNKGKKSNMRPVPDLVWPESQRKLVLRRIATYARGMGAHTLCTIQEIVISMTRTERRKPISAPPRKAKRNPILQGENLRS